LIAIIVAVVALSASAVLCYLQSRMDKTASAALIAAPSKAVEMPTTRPSSTASIDRFYRL